MRKENDEDGGEEDKKIYGHSTGHKTPLITKQEEGKLRSKFTFQVSGPPQRLCVSLTIVYTCQDHVLESLKMASTENEGPPKKNQNEDFAKNGRKNFRGYTMMRKRRKCFTLFARKQREKIHW